jgi:hypothetical protein
MNKATSIILLAALGFSACKFGETQKKVAASIFTDTATYTSQNIHKRAADCGNKPDSACTVVSIRYPVFKSLPVLNDTIKHKLLSMFMLGEKPDTGLNSMADKFLKSYTDAKKDDPKTQMFYTLDSYTRVVKQDSAFLSLEYGGYVYQGGAHGGTFTGFVNWDVKTDKKVTLDDILVDGYKTQLNKIAEKIFRKNEKLKDTSSLARDYFFKDNKFALNENYSITPLGLRFMYNQYEIKPYAAGQTELLIPYSDIKTLMRPQSVASQYINKNAGI